MIGEIFIVIIGILLALQVDNWNETRQMEARAAEFRELLRESVATDMENIRIRMDFFGRVLEYGYQVEGGLTDHGGPDTEAKWQFIVQAFHVSQIWNFTQQTATYNEVQNPDILEFLGPQELLNALQRYYSEWPQQLAVLTGGTREYRDFSRSVIPMVLQKYMWDACYEISVLDVQDFIPCTAPHVDPAIIDEVYDTIRNDPSFRKILTRRLSTLYTRNIVYDNILQEAQGLTDLLNAY